METRIIQMADVRYAGSAQLADAVGEVVLSGSLAVFSEARSALLTM